VGERAALTGRTSTVNGVVVVDSGLRVASTLPGA
jgi:hypothetical protein